jgi:hypothetical protein
MGEQHHHDHPQGVGTAEVVAQLTRERKVAHAGLVATATRFPDHNGLDDLITAAVRVVAIDKAIAEYGEPVTVVTRTDHIEIQEAR